MWFIQDYAVFMGMLQQLACDVTKTVTLRFGDLIWRYEIARVERKKQRIKGVCFHNTNLFDQKVHVAGVFHTSFGARGGY
jgi:hypothetical protein